MADVRKECGPFVDGILTALINGYGLANEKEGKKFADANLLSNHILSWAFENFVKLTKQKPKSKEELIAYIFKLLTIEYRCVNNDKDVEMPVDLANGIRNEVIIALKL